MKHLHLTHASSQSLSCVSQKIMTTKSTVAFPPSASCLFCPLPPRCPPKDICWGRVGCGLRLAASLLAGGSWTEGWACHPQEKRNRTRFKCGGGGKEREQGVHSWFLPRRSSGRTFQGYQGSLNGKWMEGGKEKNKGSFFLFWLLSGHMSGANFLQCMCVSLNYIWLAKAALEFISRFRDFSCLGAVQDTQQLWTHMRTVRFWREQLRSCRKLPHRFRLFFFFSDLEQFCSSEDYFLFILQHLNWGSSNRTASDKKITSNILLYMNVTCSRWNYVYAVHTHTYTQEHICIYMSTYIHIYI